MSASRKPIALRATLNPTEGWWQLPLDSLQGATVALIGWILETEPVDDGMPGAVAEILLRAITGLRRITFLDEAAAKTSRAKFPICTTSQPEIAMRMFEMGLFPWDQQAQVGFLSPLDAPPPALTGKQVRAVFDRKGFDPRSLTEAGVTGLLLPAVDGDFAAVAQFDDSWPELDRHLREQCAQGGVEWDIIPEADFKNTAWFASPLAPGLRR